MQDVTNEVAESLGIKPAHGALVVGVDEKGPAKPASRPAM
jgi:serine protease Do